MPSFLTTERMSPELRARVQQSLHGDARSRVGGAGALKASRRFRLILLLLLIVCGTVLTLTFRKSRAEVRASKLALSKTWQTQSAALGPVLRLRLRRIEEILLSSHKPYPGDLSDADHKQNLPRLKAALRAPLVYVRGPTRGFERPTDRSKTWGEGGPDSLIRCLIRPPTSFKESTLLRHLGDIYQPQAFRDQFINLDATFRGIAFVDSSFSTRLRDVSLLRELGVMKRELDDAHLPEAAALTKAMTFFYVFDEPKTKGTVTDFDGEAEHYMQVGAVDLATGDTLLRVRREVSPEWISDKGRLAYSRELDSCRLAFELHAEWGAN